MADTTTVCARCGGKGYLQSIFSQLCNHPPRPGQGIRCPDCTPLARSAALTIRVQNVIASACALLAQLDTANRDALADVLALDLAALERIDMLPPAVLD